MTYVSQHLKNHIYHDFRLVFWFDGPSSFDIADSLKRTNKIIILLNSELGLDTEDYRCKNAFYKVESFNLNSIVFDSWIKSFSLTPPYCLFVSDDPTILEWVHHAYPYANTADLEHVLAFVWHKRCFNLKTENGENTGFKVSVYESLLKEGSLKKAIRYLKSYPKDEFACKTLVDYYLSEGSKRSMKKAFDICIEHEDDSMTELLLSLSNFYYDGVVVKKDLDRSVELLLKMDRSHIPKSSQLLVKRLLERDMPGDVEMAIRICEDEGGNNPELFYILANVYFKGVGVESDLDYAIDCCIKAAKRKVGSARNMVVDLLRIRDAEGDAVAAFNYCNDFTREGNPWAQARLARMYRDGYSTQKDIAKAAALMKSAWDSGVSWAKKELIGIIMGDEEMMEKKGEYGLEMDLDYKMEHMKKIAKDPSKIDEAIEGLTELNGLGYPGSKGMLIDILVSTDDEGHHKTAFDICSESSSENNMWIQGRLARMYRDGVYVVPDIDKAIDLMRGPAYKGITWALNEYADMLLKRRCKGDLEEAFRACTRGVYQEDVWCQIKVARMLHDGSGVDKDVDSSIILMRTAYRKGNQTAKKELKRYLDERGTVEDKKESMKL